MERQNVKHTALRLLAVSGRITSGELAAATMVSRQTAHAVLTRLVGDGDVVAVGAGRGAHYVLTGFRSYRWDVRDLEEYHVWNELVSDSALAEAADPALSVLQYAVSEMVNNVIDHSGSDEVRVGVSMGENDVTVSIEDTGVGALEKIRAVKQLDSHFDALGQMSKGKVTTDPERHTGEGIFFTSKAVDCFTLSANGIEWTVDNLVGDVAVGVSGGEPGTTITLTHDLAGTRTLDSVFGEHTTGLAFDRSQVIVKLFQHGDTFVSRSEARRVAVGLDQFTTVVVDFSGVRRVGQGFVDELFRVWASAHEATSLEPVNMNSAVEFMVRRGLSSP
jgi:anti-sigma regulatory factor (Ser/Thr protein kinase)